SRCPQRLSALASEGGIVRMAGTNCRASYGSPPLATICPATQKQWKSFCSYQPLRPAAVRPQTNDSTSSRAAFAILPGRGRLTLGELFDQVRLGQRHDEA